MKNYNDFLIKAQSARKSNGWIAVVCFFVAALLCSGIILLSSFYSSLIVLLVPLFIFPIMFSFQRAIIYLRSNSTLSFGLFFSGIAHYFSERFRSTYGFFGEILKIFLVFIGSFFLSTMVAYFVFYYSNLYGFVDMLNEVINLPYLTIETFEYLIDKYKDVYTYFSIVVQVPTTVITTIFAFLMYSMNSISMFIRFSDVKYSGKFIRRTFKKFKKDNFSNLLKNYLSLNWPFYLLFLIGFGVGGFLGFLYQKDPNTIYGFGFAIAFFLSFSVYGLFYFANKEAIYQVYIPEIINTSDSVKDSIMRLFEGMNFNKDEIEEIIEGEDKENDSKES